MQEMWVWSLSQEDPLEEEMATHSNILAWESQARQRRLEDYSSQGHKKLDMTWWLNTIYFFKFWQPCDAGSIINLTW